MILGYLDRNGKNLDVETQRQQIIRYAEDNNLKIDIFVQETDICTLHTRLGTYNHILIIANIVALGISLPTIRENIAMFAEMNLTIVSVKEGFIWQSEDLTAIQQGLEVAINIRNSLSSIVTRRALAECKSQGMKLGRKARNKKRVFDGREEEIRKKLAKGVTKVQIAKDFGVAQGTLYAFLKSHPELKGANNA